MGMKEFFRSNTGMSSFGMLLSILVSLGLVMSGLQVYKISSYASSIQYVSDASALSAQGRVADFYSALRLADTVIFSLGLVGSIAAGTGLICASIPLASPLGTHLITASRQIFSIRKKFSDTARKALTIYKKALPFVAALSAAQTASQNNKEGHNYKAIAYLFPAVTEDLSLASTDGSEELISDAEKLEPELRDEGKEAEELMNKANESKEKAYQADCGNAPSYCCYERASSLAGLKEPYNTRSISAESWTFEEALKRCRTYYQERLRQEHKEGEGRQEEINSELRRLFYAFALEEMQGAYAQETKDSCSIYLPVLPKNTEEMLASSFATKPLFPQSYEGDELRVFPSSKFISGSIEGFVSLEEMHAQDLPVSQEYPFSVSEVGKIAALTSSVKTGYEYHWRIVASEAHNYNNLRNQADPLMHSIKDKSQAFFDKIKAFVEEMEGSRLKLKPPGHYGCVAAVLDLAELPSIKQGFVEMPQASLSTRLAVSGACIIPDTSKKDRTIISEIFESLNKNNGFLGSFGREISQVLSLAISTYSQGVKGLAEGIRDVLGTLPLVNSTGLGPYLANSFVSLLESLGLEPGDVRVFRPVTINSLIASSKDSSIFAQKYTYLAKKSHELSKVSTGGYASSIVALLNTKVESYKQILVEGVELGRVPDAGGTDIPISIEIPQFIRDAVTTMHESLGTWISTKLDFLEGLRQWQGTS